MNYGEKELIADLQLSVCQSLSDNPDWVVRIRKWNTTYFLTLKGIRTGASATEYEWEIGQDVAESIVQDGIHPSIEKRRYLWKEDALLWEMKHGPLALIEEGMPVVVLAPRDNYYKKTISYYIAVKFSYFL